jgi:hypothetical protein
MKFKMTKRIPLLLAINLSFTCLIVQASELQEVQTTLQSLGLNTSIGEVRIKESSSSASMNVPSFRIGKQTPYSGPLKVQFYNPSIAPASADVDNTLIIGEVTLNPEWRQTLLLWTRIDQDKYSIAALPNDLEALPANHLRFVNTTDSRIGIKIKDGDSKILSRGEHFSIHTNNNEAIYFWSMKEIEDGEAGAQRLSNVVEMRPGMRRTVFLTFDNATATGNMGVGPKSFSFFVLTHR